eukprot:9478052-Pyramimonas_sp.AAC.1
MNARLIVGPDMALRSTVCYPSLDGPGCVGPTMLGSITRRMETVLLLRILLLLPTATVVGSVLGLRRRSVPSLALALAPVRIAGLVLCRNGAFAWKTSFAMLAGIDATALKNCGLSDLIIDGHVTRGCQYRRVL